MDPVTRSGPQSPASSERWWVGIDVGGTFTDVVAVEEATGLFKTHKVLTTPEAQEVGVIGAIRALEVPWSAIAEVVHGHTVGINAILNRTGARTALLATEGHRDLLDIGRLNRFRPRMYDPTWLRPHQERPIVERRYRAAIPERTGWDGGELRPLDEDAVRRAARSMQAAGVESIAICFVNSYLSAEHERRAAELVREECPDLYVQTSEIYPVTKEHERTTTVALDAYVGRIVSRYLKRLADALGQLGFDGGLWVMMMNGGVQTFGEAQRNAVFQLQSGPVGGVSAAAELARTTSSKNLITMDVGGTSTDVAALREGRVPLTDVWSVEHGLTLTLPLVDVGSIGSGAGSIVRVDDLGALRVGPDSAGSLPGPACYDRGGALPTLTDACVVLGILQPDQFAGGTMTLAPALSAASFAPLAERLGMTVIDVADGAYRLACSDIAGSIRAISTYRGLDLRDYALVAFGAAGPMLAGQLATDLGVGEVIVPSHPGQLSALGLLLSDLRVTKARSPMQVLEASMAQAVEDIYAQMEAEVAEQLGRQGGSEAVFERAFYAMYMGQTWDNRLPLAPGPVTGDRIPLLYDQVHQYYQGQYGYSAEELPVIVTTLEVTGVARRPTITAALAPNDSRPSLLKTADVRLAGTDYRQVEFHRRASLQPGAAIEGPTVIVDTYSTIVVPASATAVVDGQGFIHIAQRGEEGQNRNAGCSQLVGG
jgi:N-methylhydantoinase A